MSSPDPAMPPGSIYGGPSPLDNLVAVPRETLQRLRADAALADLVRQHLAGQLLRPLAITGALARLLGVSPEQVGVGLSRGAVVLRNHALDERPAPRPSSEWFTPGGVPAPSGSTRYTRSELAEDRPEFPDPQPGEPAWHLYEGPTWGTRTGDDL